jgi:hypothetical protein
VTTRRRRASVAPPESVPAKHAPETDSPAPAEQETVDVEQAAEEAHAEAGDWPQSVAAMLAHIDGAWHAFWSLAVAFPTERMDEAIGRGWTRKQMLAHVAAWHDSATERLLALAATGERRPADPVDVFNARVARVAAGRTSGEVLNSADASLRRLRRQIEMLDDERLAADRGWAAGLIAANTYEHWREHEADLHPPPGDLSSSR